MFMFARKMILSPFEFSLLPKDLNFIIYLLLTEAVVVPCDGPSKSPRTSTIVPNYIFLSVNWNQLEYSEYSRDIF